MDFNPKSHIIKHWRITHPEMIDMPRIEFRISGRFKDALSRQVSEAMDIYFTKDNILNSKSEYVKNCISRLTVGEQDWERKERERQEELDELVEKDEVEKFKQDILRKRKIRDYEKTRDREEENESKRESANTPPPSKSSEEEADVSSHEEYKDESTDEPNE